MENRKADVMRQSSALPTAVEGCERVLQHKKVDPIIKLDGLKAVLEAKLLTQ